MKIHSALFNGLLIILCYLFIGCASVQQTQWIKTTESLEVPHTILLVGRSPEIVSVNGEPLEPNSVSTRTRDFMTLGDLKNEIRIPIGECHVKAYFPNWDGSSPGGYMAAKKRQDAPIYTFVAKRGVIYRAMPDAPLPKFAGQAWFRKEPKVQIIEDESGMIVPLIR